MPEPEAAPRPISIVVPTFREAANLPRLAERIQTALEPTGIAWELLLVDDDSDDGTPAAAAALAQRLPLRLIVRREPPRDLSLSVLHGLECSRHDRIVVMDADLSHPPEAIPALLAALDRNGAMAIGSRYMSGGSFDRTWGLRRFLSSRLATMLTNPLTGCSDPMSGFFAIDRRALPALSAMRPTGYKIGLELMVRSDLEAEEIPIEFHNRHLGASKMNWRQQARYLRHLARLYRHKFGGPFRAVFFGLVGLTGVFVDVACYLAFQTLGLEHRMARFLSFWAAVTWNWALNRYTTFRDRRQRPHLRQWLAFVASSLLGFGASFGSYLALTSHVEFFQHQRLLAMLVGIALGSGLNFAASNLYVYRHYIESGPDTRPNPK